MNLQPVGVSVIFFTETNINWRQTYLINKFKTIIKTVRPSKKAVVCISDSQLRFTSEFKQGGTAIVTLEPISSAIVSKGYDPLGLRRWTYTTMLGKKLKQTTMFNAYRPCNTPIDTFRSTTIVKQQWLLTQNNNRPLHIPSYD